MTLNRLRETRKARKLARLLVALDAEAAHVRPPARPRLLRGSAAVVR